jgi:hypothetical protein
MAAPATTLPPSLTARLWLPPTSVEHAPGTPQPSPPLSEQGEAPEPGGSRCCSPRPRTRITPGPSRSANAPALHLATALSPHSNGYRACSGGEPLSRAGHATVYKSARSPA